MLCFTPFWLMIVNATRSGNKIMTGFSLLPSGSLADNWKIVSENMDLGRGFLNSLFLALCNTALVSCFSALTACGLAYYKFKGAKLIFTALGIPSTNDKLVQKIIRMLVEVPKGGYMEQWEYHKTYSGTPQGSGMSPILANIYLSGLDTFVEECKARFDTEPFKRNASKEYEKTAGRYRKAKEKLDAGNPSKEDIQEFKAAQKLKLSTPCDDVLDADFKRIQYNRCADDFVAGLRD